MLGYKGLNLTKCSAKFAHVLLLESTVIQLPLKHYETDRASK